MRRQAERYLSKLRRFLALDPHSGGVAVADDRILTAGDPTTGGVAAEILQLLDAVSLFVVPLPIPFVDCLIARAGSPPAIVPRDTETRTFLHDIPVVSRREWEDDRVAAVVERLKGRKGVAVEGFGLVAVGSLTVEQGYVNVSSLFHALFVRYLESLLEPSRPLPGEGELFERIVLTWGGEIRVDRLVFHPGPLSDRETILDEMIRVGRWTVELGLVDSFFGNVSCRAGDTIYISQTASSLDELAGCIDPVPMDGSSTAGITASSELAAHRRIYETTSYDTILHGHPRWSVVMSMICDRRGECGVADCGRDCPDIRMVEGVPVVAGEIGAGGLARTVPPVIGRFGVALVHGHGLFAAGRGEFGEPFRRMVEIENRCRRLCIRRIREHLSG